MRQVIFSLFLTTLIIFTGNAQAPQAINYQGVARDASGNPIANTTISIRASVLDGSATGTVEYSEVQNPTTNQFGLFTIAIGKGTVQAGVFAYIGWAHDTCYLKIEIDPTGGSNYVLSGTSQILSTPYAIFANNGFLNIPSNSYTAAQLDNSSTNIGGGFFGKNGGDNYLRSFWGYTIDRNDGNYGFSSSNYFNGALPDGGSFAVRYRTSSTAFRTDFIIRDTGNVGIGTSNPGSALEVANGDIKVSNIGSGMILTSPSGYCFRITTDDSGNLTTTQITCP